MIANQNSGCDSCNQLKRVVARPDVNSVNIPRLHRYTRRGPHSPPHLSSHPSLTTYQLRSYTNKYQRLSIVYSARAERHKFRGVKGFAISHPGRRAALTLQSRAGLHSDCGRPTTTTRPASCGLHCVRYVIKYISCWRGRLADVEQDPDQGGISLLSDHQRPLPDSTCGVNVSSPAPTHPQNAVLQLFLEHPSATQTPSPTTIARGTHTSGPPSCQPTTEPIWTTPRTPAGPQSRPEPERAHLAHGIPTSSIAGPPHPRTTIWIAISTDTTGYY